MWVETELSRERRGQGGWRAKGQPPFLQLYLEETLESQAVGGLLVLTLRGAWVRGQTVAQTHTLCGGSLCPLLGALEAGRPLSRPFLSSSFGGAHHGGRELRVLDF